MKNVVPDMGPKNYKPVILVKNVLFIFLRGFLTSKLVLSV